jgi:hypothetical protein
VESIGKERLMMDGKAGMAVRSEIQSPEACGVNSAVWAQESQGSSPGLERPDNLSRVLAPDVKYCRIKTMPRVARKDLLEIQTAGCCPLPPPDQGAETWVNWLVSFIGGAKPWWRERVSGL